MQTPVTWIMGCLAVAIVGTAIAQTPSPTAPLLRHTFDESEQGWTGMGPSSKISITHESANVKVGTGALKFDYQVAKGEMNGAIFPASEPIPVKTKTVRFWIKTDYNASLALVCYKREPGGHYSAVFSTPANKWQEVVMPLSDMILSDGKNDPKDPDNKLDVDQIAGFGIVDSSQAFIQADNPELLKLLNIKTGPHTLYLDDFLLGADSPTSPIASTDEVVLDDYGNPQANWMAVGLVDARITSGKPLDGRCMQADYKTGPTSVIGLVRSLHAGALTGMKKLGFSIALAHASHLIVQVEETDGGKYNAIVDATGGNTVQKIDIPFANFVVSDDSKDTNSRLDVPLIKSISLIDMAGLASGSEQENTLWVGPIKALNRQ